jgi:hypothetical protein
MVEEILISTNKTILLIGKIVHLEFPDDVMQETGQLDLEKLNTTGISGLDRYYKLEKIAEYPYVKLSDQFKS